jgi:hypothetical protein
MSPQIVPAVAGQAASGGFNVWRRGDILVNTPVGNIVTPSGGASSGGTSLATTAGPALAAGQGVFTLISTSTSITSGAVTVTAATSANNPAQTYYCIVTYTNTTGSNESLSSQEFIIQCPAGLAPQVTVASASAPTGAATFALYVGLYPGYEALQQATKYTTSLGTAFTIPAPQLTNSIGLSRAATNASAAMFGMAVDDSNALFYNSIGNVGNQSLFGVTMTQPPLTAADAYNNLVYKLQSQTLEMNLVQPFYPSVIGGAVAGLLLDPTTGFFVADTSQSNKVLNILQAAVGPQGFEGGVGITGTRVWVQFASGLV